MGRGVYFLLVFDFWCLKSRSILSVELLDAQWGYVVDFLFKQGKAACNFISFLYFIKTTRFNKKRVQKEKNWKLQKTEVLQRKDSKSWSSKLGAEHRWKTGDKIQSGRYLIIISRIDHHRGVRLYLQSFIVPFLKCGRKSSDTE